MRPYLEICLWGCAEAPRLFPKNQENILPPLLLKSAHRALFNEMRGAEERLQIYMRALRSMCRYSARCRQRKRKLLAGSAVRASR